MNRFVMFELPDGSKRGVDFGLVTYIASDDEFKSRVYLYGPWGSISVSGDFDEIFETWRKVNS